MWVLKNDRTFLRTCFCSIFRSEKVSRGSRTMVLGKLRQNDFSENFFFSFASADTGILTDFFFPFFFFRKIFFFLAIFFVSKKNLVFLFLKFFEIFWIFWILDFLDFLIFWFFEIFNFLDFLIFYFFEIFEIFEIFDKSG